METLLSENEKNNMIYKYLITNTKLFESMLFLD
jgi:hypothetical protein